MKKSFVKFLTVSLASLFAVSLVSCPGGNSPDTGSENDTALSYSYITANRSFIGGSLIYNPDDTTGKYSQLEVGTKIGVRLGQLQEKKKDVYTFASQTESILSDENDDSVVDPNGSVKGAEVSSLSQVSASIQALAGGTAEKATYYEDIPSKAEYGYITIDLIGPESISLTFTKVLPGNASTAKSFTLKKGDRCDLNGNGKYNLFYGDAAIKRKDFGENTRWLTFINSETDLSSTLFYTFTQSEVRSCYRSAEPEKIDEGLYAVNSNGDFVYVYYEELKTDPYMAYGDYVICLPGDTGLTEENFSYGKESALNLVSMDDSTTDTNEFFEAVDALPMSEADFALKGKTYVITLDENDNLKEVELKDYKNSDVVYTYQIWQFPDDNRGPEELLEEISRNEAFQEILKSYNSVLDEENRYKTLNDLLTDDDFFYALIDVLVDDENDRLACKLTYDHADDALRIKYCRILLDDLYDCSPEALPPAPKIENIYPHLYVSIGDVTELSDIVYDSSYNVLTENVSEQGRKIHSKYSEYKQRHTELEKEWKSFYTLDFTKFVLFPSDKDKETKLPIKDWGIYLGVGVKGCVCITSGYTYVSLSCAVWLDIDLTLSTIVNGLLSGDVNSSLKDSMEGCLKKLFENTKAEVKATDVNFNICGVPFVMGASIKFGINLSFGNYNPHVCFSGMYGASGSLSADYGIKWFMCPYFTASSSASAINHTDFYIGVEDSSASSTDITFEPYFKFSPSFGLGCSVVSVRAAVPIKLGSHVVLTLPDVKLKEFGLLIGAYFEPYFEADLKVVTISKTFCCLKPIDHNLILYPEPIRFVKR